MVVRVQQTKDVNVCLGLPDLTVDNAVIRILNITKQTVQCVVKNVRLGTMVTCVRRSVRVILHKVFVLGESADLANAQHVYRGSMVQTVPVRVQV